MEADGPRLAPQYRLRVRLGALFFVLSAAFVLVAWQAGTFLQRDRVLQEAQRYPLESGLRLSQQVEDWLERSRLLAAHLADARTADAIESPARVASLIEASGLAPLLLGVGWWPEPAAPDAPRNSRFWLMDAQGALQARRDYNDPRAIAYWREAWYTPARYGASGRCYWTPVFVEPLSRRRVLGCTLPVREASRLVGMVTVLLDAEALQRSLRSATAAQPGYVLLADRDNTLIALAGRAETLDAQRPRNLAQLAQAAPALNPLALALHARDAAFQESALRSANHDPAQIAALKDGTRDFSTQEARSALALIRQARDGSPNGAAETLALADDPVLHAPASAAVFELPGAYWKLVRVTAADEGVGGAQRLFTQTVAILGGALALILLLAFLFIDGSVVRPLRRMTQTLSDARSLDESLHLHLEAHTRSEVGVIGHRYNERLRQLREAMDRVLLQQSRLVLEATERGRNEDQTLRLRERTATLLQALSEAVILLDARNLVEDLNAAAERLTGSSARALRGKPVTEALALRLQRDGTHPLAAPPGEQRIEFADGVFLKPEGRAEREVQLLAAPVRGGGKPLGTVLVLRARDTQTASPTVQKLVIDRRSLDPLTGLATRLACDRRLRALLDGAGLQARRHALVVADIDGLRRINERHGRAAGDEALARLAEALAARGETFRLSADGFALLLEDQDPAAAAAVAQEVSAHVQGLSMRVGDAAFRISASFGVLGLDTQADAPMELLRRAEDACAAAKAAGPGAVRVYEPGMSAEAERVDDARWARRIQSGLQENLLHLTTTWVGAREPLAAEGAVYEVALSLEDEEGFWAEPAQFLPAAQRTGLVAAVECHGLRLLIEHLARDPALCERVALCCYALSPQTVADGATLEGLAQLLQTYPQVPSSRLCFVLREDVLHDVPGPAATFCDALRSLGAQVCVEQFLPRGAGALELLRRLPVQVLRVDARAFGDPARDPFDQALADAAQKLARGLGARLMVAGLEREPLRDAWLQRGADYVQGPAVARVSPVVFGGA